MEFEVRIFLKDICWVVFLAAFCIGIGWTLNWARAADGISLSYQRPAERLMAKAESRGVRIEIVDAMDVLGLVEEGTGLLVDVRPASIYQMGHVPGAINLQQKAYQEDLTRWKKKLEKAKQDGKRVVLYCAGSYCPDAAKVGQRLVDDLGIGEVFLFEGGWEIWQMLGFEEEQ